MESVFLKLVNLGISASWLVLAVLVLRLVFRRAPKWIFCLLWALVALRLVCPFSLESTLSLIPSAQPLPPEILDTARPQIHSGIPAINSAVNPLLERGMAPAPGASTNPTQVWFLILSYIWVIGALVMALYALISYWLLKRRVATATLLRENIRQSEYVDTPFVLGLFRPIIYLPYGLEQKEQNYVVAHEKAHIKRRDHWWKPLGFSLLTVYWFNPLMWLAYILLCRDIEGACDEKAIREMGLEDRRGYSTALLQCSIHRHRLAACPLAFGEVGVKVRIKSVMNYKRPAFWIVAAALAACVVAAVCFLTDPPSRREFSMDGTNLANLDPQDIVEQIENLEDTSQLYVNGDNFEITLTSDFQWESSETVRFFYFKNQETYSAQLRISPQENKYFITQAGRWPEQDSIFLLVNYLEALKYLPQAEIRQMLPHAVGYAVSLVEEGSPENYPQSLTYTPQGAGTMDGWYVHLLVEPVYENNEGTPASEGVHLFYGGEHTAPTVTKWFDYTGSPSEMDWNGELTTELPQFPGVTFCYTPEQITARSLENAEPITLFTGMPIWNTYFCDLTGDGLPELCATLSWGSGMIDSRVIIYDYANGASYLLEDRSNYDYSLRYDYAENCLYVDRRPYMEKALVSSNRLAYVDGCIQLVGEESGGDSFSQKTTILPGNYDLDHDGTTDTVELVTVTGEFPGYELLVKKANGAELWRGIAHPAHPGYNSFFVCCLEDGDYLLQYNPMMYQGNATYTYQLFSLDEEGNPVTAQEGSVSFDVNWGTPLHESFDALALADFMDELNGLLAQSKMLLSTDPALESVDPERPQANLWWLQDTSLCNGFVYNKSKSLRENLIELAEFIKTI